jgi:hypothetical protein
MSARAMMLRRNLATLLPEFEAEDLGVLLEAAGYELVSRGYTLGSGFWGVTHVLLGVSSGHVGNLRQLYSGDGTQPGRLHPDWS